MCDIDGSFSHRMTVIVTKNDLPKLKLTVVNYRDYKRFNNVRYRNDLLKELSNCYLEFNDRGFSEVFLFMRTTLYQHASQKQKYAQYMSFTRTCRRKS